MKKLLLILSAVFVSVMAWAQNNSTAGLAYTLNPYAYDLSIKSWDLATRQLTVQFKLNAPPNLDDSGTNNTGPYNTGIADKEPNGIQIYAVDQSGNEYRIGGLGRDVIQKGINNGYFEYTMDLSAGTTVEFNGGTPKALPVDEPLTWKVRVKGRSNQHVDAYKVPRHVTARPTDFKRPRRVMGVGVGTNPLSPNFGRLFTSEADNGVSSNGNSTFGWLYDALYDPDYKSSHVRMPAMLEYTPQLKFVGVHKKYIDDSDNNSHFELQMYSEPHRVRVSEDGRIFVSSYHQGAGAAVKEYLGNNTFRTVIGFDANENEDKESSTGYPSHTKYNRRAIDFDVKGSGDDLKIIVAWIKPKGEPAKGDNTQWNTSIEIYEYAVGKNYDFHQTSGGALVAKYTESNPTNSYCGYLFQAYYNTNYAAQRALVGVAYGSGENDIWLKVDPGVNFETSLKQARIIYFNKAKGNTPQNVTELDINERYEVAAGDGMPAGEFYGGGSIIVKDNKLYTYAAMTATGNAGVLRVYTINSGTLTKDKDIALGVSSPWANGFAIDYANNLYLVSEWMGNIKTISLPYSGVIETPAPANSTFSLADPVPNIYATNLRYEAVEGAPKYKFSFNVNTQPKYAEIRFYKSYESMKKSMSAVNADDFKGGKTTRDNDLYCYYPISGLKQGKIEVEFGMVGGIINQQTKELTNARLPRGELYWSVYVETDKSAAFAPIYRQPLTGNDAHYHMHAIVNDNPETDQFGTIYGAQEDKRDVSTNKRSSLMIYEISDNGSDVHNITNTTRYTKKQEYLYNTSDSVYNAKPRRMAIAPDGTVYIAHEGKDNQNHPSEVASWLYGGIYAWNPNEPTENGKLKLSKFSNNKIGTSSAVALYGHVSGNDTTWKMYAANSYGEFSTHEGGYYTNDNQRDVTKFGWNGFVEYVKGKATNWSSWLNIKNANLEYKLKQGDGSGNNSLVAMDKGVWICQHREHSIDVKIATKEVFADNRGALVLSFVPYGNNTANADWGPRTWRSSTTDGGRNKDESGKLTIKEEVKSELTQKDGALLQATPGAGMAYRKINGVDYLFINNHDGNIVQLQVDWKASTTPATPEVHVSKAKVLTTPSDVKGTLSVNGNKSVPWKTAAISSMSFDFAGNLVTTTGVSYLKLTIPQLLSGDEDKFKTPEGGQSIIIYTMPYDRTNAREIQAPKSNIFIPERLAQLNMTDEDIQKILTEHNDHGSQCYIDLYRPMQGGMFNTFCVPFELNTTLIPTDHPLYGAEIRRFTGVTLSESGGENILTLNFENLINNTMAANVPHIINPKSNIKSIIPFDWLQVLAKNTEVESPYFDFDNGNRITYQGILPKTQVDARYDQNLPLRLILVADNRLAALTGNGEMYGFRGYFDLLKPLPPGTVAKISAKKDTPTNTTIVVDGKKVNIDKYLREGRVYIRVGDSLYTIDGQVVE